MKIKHLIILLFLSYSVRAQDIGLNIGDKLPEFQISKIINGSSRIASTSDFKDKLLIIDFWSRGCMTCIEIMPNMKALQQQFGNQIKILPVTYEKEDEVAKFLKQNKYTKPLNVETAVEDTIFHSYFKHISIPHEIWIYKNKVIGITDNEFVDSLNIQKVLDGAKINWPVKNDFYHYDKKKPIFEVNARDVEGYSSPRAYVALSGYKEKVRAEGMNGGQGIVMDSIAGTIRSYYLNVPILNLYLSQFLITNDVTQLVRPDVYFKPDEMPNQIVWEVKDRRKYTWEKQFGYSQEWLRKYGICFEATVPNRGQAEDKVAKGTIANLNAVLDLNVRWEKRKERVYVLVRNGKGSVQTSGEFTYMNVPSSSIKDYFNAIATNPYLFDETGEKEYTMLKLDIKSWTDIDGLRRSLGPYGYEIKEEIREVDKLIFTENGYNTNKK